ncbi:MAG: hypothetical protein JOZ04_02800 [Acidimicrobiia bacterium]|nr:hypothetical protein [Acidimicrobiia bacterium]
MALIVPMAGMVLASTQTPAAAATVTITPLGFPDNYGEVGLNAQGDAVAETGCLPPACEGTAVLWKASDHSLHNLGALAPTDSSIALGVNRFDTAVGWDAPLDGDPSSIAVEFVQGGVVNLGQSVNLGQGTSALSSAAYGINDAGTVVGDASIDDGPQHAIEWQRVLRTRQVPSPKAQWVATQLDPADSSSVAFAIDEAGDAVGSATKTSGGSTQAAEFSNGTVTYLGGASSNNTNRVLTPAAFGISPDGQFIVGTDAQGAEQFHPGAPATILGGGQGASADGVNDFDTAVGTAVFGNYLLAAVFSGGQVINLNSLLPPNSGWTLWRATGINDANQIVGTGSLNGQPQDFEMQVPATFFLQHQPPCLVPLLCGLTGPGGPIPRPPLPFPIPQLPFPIQSLPPGGAPS